MSAARPVLARTAPRIAPDANALAAEALAVTAGAALVLDHELRVVLATPPALELLDMQQSPLGVPAPKLLCGRSPKRHLAQALVEGRAVDAVIPHPSDPRAGKSRMLRVRSWPLANTAARKGFLLLLDEAAAHDEEPVEFHGLWTRSAAMKEVFRVIERVAPEDATVLVRGETGTGKELVARALHALSSRKEGPFRALNCAALPPNLLESELFGHIRGAFTGAVKDSKGHVQLAHKGTLFLDEVAELPLELQAKLLRVLETRMVLPVGGRTPLPVDVRIVSATHRALRKEVDAGRFRADLMYRLRVVPIYLPPLRERRQDIPLLCEKLLLALGRGSRRRAEYVSPAALRVLTRYDWPGNVRELSNVLAYALVVGDGPIVQATDLPSELLDGAPQTVAQAEAAQPAAATSQSPEAQRILTVLARTRGNKSRAAQILGISRVTLWRRLKAFGIAETP